MNWNRVTTPLSDTSIEQLHTGDGVLISGTLYTARDKAHARIVEMTRQGQRLPFDPAGQVLYYMGPSPAQPGQIIGAAGPTTSGRMDPFTKTILELGFRGLIGKGSREPSVRRLICDFRSVYLSTFGGAAAYLSKRIQGAELILFPDLGPEAMHLLTVLDFPAIVVNDQYGGDLYERSVYR